MTSFHVTFELLAAQDEGRITRQEVLENATRHLLETCPPCAAEYGAFAAERGEELGWGEEDLERQPERTEHGASEYTHVVRGVAEAAPDLEEHLHREAVQAARELRELLALPHEEALGKIHRARTRFRSPSLAQLLLAEVRSALPDRPREALERAELAEKVAWRLSSAGRPLPSLQAELGVLAVAHQGNAHRVLDDLRAADRSFDFARGTADHNGVVDPAVLAELDALEGSLRRDQRRFGEAEHLIRRSVTLAVAAEDRLRVVRSLLKLGSLYHAQGALERALSQVDAALQALPPEAPHRLRLCAVHNRLDCLCDLGEHSIAEELLQEAQPLYRQFDDPWTVHRVGWLKGKIARGSGRMGEAISQLEVARMGFASAGARYDAALVSLELAELHLDAGRPSEGRRVAAEALPLFASLRIPREAAAALAQVRRAVAQESGLSAALLRRLMELLRRNAPA